MISNKYIFFVYRIDFFYIALTILLFMLYYIIICPIFIAIRLLPHEIENDKDLYYIKNIIILYLFYRHFIIFHFLVV